ncbi:MAG: hypothetical protein LBT24_05650 [Tannerella sp.]|jgi:hypothetical protein|nr:hypothetical protein [Tannerella sp.]
MQQQTDIKFSANLFWDANPDDLDLNKHKTYVVGRVLDYGEWSDWLAIKDLYGMEELKNIALRIRTMFPKSLSFIATMTHTPENQFRCYEQVKNNKNENYFIS